MQVPVAGQRSHGTDALPDAYDLSADHERPGEEGGGQPQPAVAPAAHLHRSLFGLVQERRTVVADLGQDIPETYVVLLFPQGEAPLISQRGGLEPQVQRLPAADAVL